MGHQSEHTDQQDQNSGSVLQVVVQFPGNPAQAQQPDHFQRAEQTAHPLGVRKKSGGEMRVNEKEEPGRGNRRSREEQM